MVEARKTQRRPWLPDALPASLGRVGSKIRVAWLGLLALVAVVQLSGLGFVLYDAYQINPAFRAIGISTEFDDDDRQIVRPLRADVVAAGIGVGDRIVSIAGKRFEPDASELSLARALMATSGDVVQVGFRKPDGREVSLRVSRSSRAPVVVAPIPISLNLRMGVRLFFTLLSSLALLGSSLVLLLRRPHDPEAFLFGVGFLGAAASVDPPLLMWMSIGAGWVIDVFTGLWWTALVIALAAFPDGRFTPSWLRWSLIAAPLLGLVLALDRVRDVPALLVAVCVPLMLLGAQMVRYRRLPPGLERQQIKWAGFGFAAGFLLIGVAAGMSLARYDDWPAAARGAWLLTTICLFNLGFAIMPLGLLISLIRFRLWDVDRVISRSVAYTLLTGAIGLLWALLSDVAKQLVASLLGQGHALLGLALGAMVAAGVFAPTQRVVLRWSKRRFNPSSLDLERLPERLRVWRELCDAPQVAARALDVAMRALHASAGAIFARTPKGRTLLANRSIDPDDAEPPPFPGSTAPSIGAHVLHLEDEDGLAGWLILSPRDDGSRFPKSDLATLAATAGPLAQALRVAAPASRGEAAVLNLLDEVQQRVARLEQGQARPA
jgi:hypothetical protein